MAARSGPEKVGCGTTASRKHPPAGSAGVAGRPSMGGWEKRFPEVGMAASGQWNDPQPYRGRDISAFPRPAPGLPGDPSNLGRGSGVDGPWWLLPDLPGHAPGPAGQRFRRPKVGGGGYGSQLRGPMSDRTGTRPQSAMPFRCPDRKRHNFPAPCGKIPPVAVAVGCAYISPREVKTARRETTFRLPGSASKTKGLNCRVLHQTFYHPFARAFRSVGWPTDRTGVPRGPLTAPPGCRHAP